MTNSVHLDDYQDAIGQNIAARLSEGVHKLPHDISERLKVARMQALSKRKIVRLQTVPAMALDVNANGSAATLLLGGGSGHPFLSRIALLLPLLALIAGLLTIAVSVEDNRTDEIAELDAELLTDDLPPDAYTDPGFAQYLRLNRQD